jgi:hypothetical protein
MSWGAWGLVEKNENFLATTDATSCYILGPRAPKLEKPSTRNSKPVNIKVSILN